MIQNILTMKVISENHFITKILPKSKQVEGVTTLKKFGSADVYVIAKPPHKSRASLSGYIQAWKTYYAIYRGRIYKLQEWEFDRFPGWRIALKKNRALNLAHTQAKIAGKNYLPASMFRIALGSDTANYEQMHRDKTKKALAVWCQQQLQAAGRNLIVTAIFSNPYHTGKQIDAGQACRTCITIATVDGKKKYLLCCPLEFAEIRRMKNDFRLCIAWEGENATLPGY